MTLRHRTLGLALAALLLGACAGEPTIQTGDDAETIMGNLNRVDNARVALAYVDPEADYSRYTRVLIEPLDLDNVEIVQPDNMNSMVNRYNREWELSDADKATLQVAFDEAMRRELTAGGLFEIASASGDDVLVIDAMLTRLAPSASRDDMTARTSARSRVYTQGAGSISIAIAFGDGDSGEVLAIIKDTRSNDNGAWGLNNSVTNMAEVRRTFTSWAKRIHDGLAALRQRREAGGA
jgi:uncharacterized lipoprotein YajG